MTGALVVVGIRAQALSDDLQAALYIARRTRQDPFAGPRAPGISWSAQRLASSCEKALGIRQRHYDEVR